MKIEKPCSPGHCLGMLNANMRTDILRYVHDGVRTRMDEQDKKALKRLQQKSPLEMLIESIEDVLATYDGSNLVATIGRNPFNTDPRYYRFQPEPDYRHDIKLLKSQLASLREILAEIRSWD